MSERHISVRTYLIVYGLLLLFTILTVAAAQVDLGAFNILVSLTIAAVKAGLIVVFFMHVRYSIPLVRITIAASLLWLGILIVGTLNDVVTRAWLHVPGR
jgi:cytochrome c oxidase subunit 4